MSHAFVKNHIHLVFSTKDRQTLHIQRCPPELLVVSGWHLPQPENGAKLSTACRTTRIFFFTCRQRLRWAKAISTSKKPTLPNEWMNEHGRRFAWQEGYGAFSVSVSNTATVAKYIRNQEQHHRKMTFEQEYRRC